MPSATLSRAVTSQEAADALRQQLGSGYKITPHPGGSADKLTVSHGMAAASMRLERGEAATTIHVHGRGLIIGLIVNELGIARTVTTAMKQAFGASPGTAQARDNTS